MGPMDVRWMAGRRIAAVAVGAALVLGACGASGGGATEVEASSEPVSAAGCEAIELLLLQPADESEEEAPAPSDEEALASMERLLELVPADDRDDFSGYVELLRAYVDDPAAAPTPTAEDLAVIDRLIPWGQEQCPPGYPVWGCIVSRSSFRPIGESIDDTTGTTGPTYSSAEEGAQAWGAEGERLVLAESDEAMTFGWLDDDGLVEETKEFHRVADGWAAGASTECQFGEPGEPTFDSIGESISG